jgi:hypothetical protein
VPLRLAQLQPKAAMSSASRRAELRRFVVCIGSILLFSPPRTARQTPACGVHHPADGAPFERSASRNPAAMLELSESGLFTDGRWLEPEKTSDFRWLILSLVPDSGLEYSEKVLRRRIGVGSLEPDRACSAGGDGATQISLCWVYLA